jgi:hypothetical protein
MTDTRNADNQITVCHPSRCRRHRSFQLGVEIQLPHDNVHRGETHRLCWDAEA